MAFHGPNYDNICLHHVTVMLKLSITPIRRSLLQWDCRKVNRKRNFLLGCMALVALPGIALAQSYDERPRAVPVAMQPEDENSSPSPSQMLVDERAGGWVAIHHTPDAGVHTDLCIAGSESEILMFRADADSLQVRSADDHWTLANGEKGDMTVTVGAYTRVFHMQANDATTLAADIHADDLTRLLDAMATSHVALVKFGDRTTLSVNLAGSIPVLDRFRGCAETQHFANLGQGAGQKASPF
ncbi:hypothetical protein KOEU_22760 [Komagataeibacter europaeus]|uniref:Invasion associated locus B (IalB) protein n=1 Tax=Komagataeibacter europaeus TaxID=33995 RepID=A0A0M0EG12_KOMEU|nr:hypothetical protein KOEU_22760 [Komagataeibacter europaeus]